MGELLEGLFGIIVIVIAISRLNRNSKKIQKNAPGQSGGSIQNTPSVQPTVKPTAPQGSFWEQMMMEFGESSEEETPAVPKSAPIKQVSAQPKTSKKAQKHKGHTAVGSLAEGASRECDYGSIGGSMAYTHTDGEAEGRRTIAVQNTQSEPQTAYRPAMTAEEMRQAIVMAEILKTPQERMAEQARRWNRQ